MTENDVLYPSPDAQLQIDSCSLPASLFVESVAVSTSGCSNGPLIGVDLDLINRLSVRDFR